MAGTDYLFINPGRVKAASTHLARQATMGEQIRHDLARAATLAGLTDVGLHRLAALTDKLDGLARLLAHKADEANIDLALDAQANTNTDAEVDWDRYWAETQQWLTAAYASPFVSALTTYADSYDRYAEYGHGTATTVAIASLRTLVSEGSGMATEYAINQLAGAYLLTPAAPLAIAGIALSPIAGHAAKGAAAWAFDQAYEHGPEVVSWIWEVHTAPVTVARNLPETVGTTIDHLQDGLEWLTGTIPRGRPAG